MSKLTVIPFSFEGNGLRVFMRGDVPWFVARDVCGAIGINNNRTAVEKLDDDEKGADLIDTPGGVQKMLTVNESGLNALIMRSRDAMTAGSPAHKYRKWVTSEVLPSIRKTGAYGTPREVSVPANYIAALEDLLASKKAEALALGERDYAIRTKHLIGSKREATAMATASVAVREVNRLRDELGFSARHATIL